jgi:hypothetical protein
MRHAHSQRRRYAAGVPYPLRAKYDCSGSADDAANFVPAAPIVPPAGDIIDWAGSYLHTLPGPVAR